QVRQQKLRASQSCAFALVQNEVMRADRKSSFRRTGSARVSEIASARRRKSEPDWYCTCEARAIQKQMRPSWYFARAFLYRCENLNGCYCSLLICQLRSDR